jgi:hypothetical protein
MSKRQRPKAAPEPLPRRSAAQSVAAATPAPVSLWRTAAWFLILLTGMLLLWRLVLLQPLETLQRGAIQGCFRMLPLPGSESSELITVDRENGDWIVHASLLQLQEREETRQIAGTLEAGVRLQPAMLQLFSLGLPLYWALSLTVWPGKELWRVLGIGTLLEALVAQLSLVVFLAHWINRYFVVASSPGGEFCLQSVGYFMLNVAPYAGPLVLVIWMHPRLRSLVFGVFPSRTQPSPAP